MNKPVYPIEEPQDVELLTLQTERLLHGGPETDERTFDSLEKAIKCAEHMSAEQQAASWFWPEAGLVHTLS